MSVTEPAASPTERLSQFRRIIGTCDRFEAAWASGGRPPIEAFLADAPEHDRAALLRELVLLELELRGRTGERPTAEEYHARFPDQSSLIDSAFDSGGAPTFAHLSGPDAPTTCLPTATLAGDEAGDRPRPSQAPAPGEVLGDYELLERIGRGGMGIVYRARQRTTDRIVALKLMKPEWFDDLSDARSREAIERFQSEARAAALLEHDHIVTVFEVGQFQGRHFYSMRLVEGRSLAEVLRDGPIPDREAAAYLEPIARAVHHAHANGIMHRDLKPGNILLDAQGRPFVTDFGLAKWLEGTRQLTKTLALMGSPPYMSPEQARDAGRVGAPSDVYSLGATLYEMLTGRPPFQAADPVETLRQVIDEEPVPPRKLNPAIDRDIETICLKCLEKEPARRYPTAALLAEDLKHYLSNEPLWARPLNPWGRAVKWVRRRPTVAALVGVGVVAVVAVVALLLDRAYNVHLKAALERERASAHMARQAVNMIIDLSEETLVDQPGMQPLGKGLLEAALPFYQDFLKSVGDDAALHSEVLSELAAISFRVGVISDEVGLLPKALENYKIALAIRQRQAARDPKNLEIRNELAEVYHVLGVVYRATGHPDEALRCYLMARDLREALTEHPRGARFESDLGRTYGYLGDLQIEIGQRDEAFNSYTRSHLIRKRLALAHPDDQSLQFQLGRSYENLGRHQDATGRPDEALEYHRQAASIQAKLHDARPRSPRFQDDLARSLYYIGILGRKMGDPSGAIDSLEEARAMQEGLVRDNPTVNTYQNALARTLNEISPMRLEEGRTADAERAARRALEVIGKLASESPDSLVFRSEQAQAWNNLGNVFERAGRLPEALEAHRSAVARQRGAFEKADRMTAYRLDLVTFLMGLARVDRALGRTDEASATTREAEAIRSEARPASDGPDFVTP